MISSTRPPHFGAMGWQDERGRLLMRENPLRGFKPAGERNPRRAVASSDRYEAVRAVANQVTMEVRWDGHRRVRRSYIAEILDLAAGTGRRITAICSLRTEDLRLQPTDIAPHGAIRWPAATDKMGREWTVPVGPEVRSALLRVLEDRGLQAGYLFPSPKSPDRPITRSVPGTGCARPRTSRSWSPRREAPSLLTGEGGDGSEASPAAGRGRRGRLERNRGFTAVLPSRG